MYGKETGKCYSRPFRSIEEIFEKTYISGMYNRSKLLQDLALLELERGNYSKSISLMNASIKALPIEGYWTARGTYKAVMAYIYASAGDFKAAQSALNDSFVWYGRSRSYHEDNWKKFHLNRARAMIDQNKGYLVSAEQFHKKAIAAYEKVGTGGQNCYAKADLAENLMLQGRLLEAENLAREVLISDRCQGEPRGFLVFSRILIEQGRYSEAESVATAAINPYLSNTDCSAVFYNLSRQTLARSLVAQQRWEEAVAQFERIKDDMKNEPDVFRLRFSGNTDWALALLALGQTGKATEILNSGLKLTESRLGKKHYQTAEIHGFLAISMAAEGKHEEALKEFNIAIPILLSKTEITDEEILNQSDRYQRLKFIIEGYLKLLDEVQGSELENKSGINAPQDSFIAADYVRNFSIQQAINACNVRAFAKEEKLANLIRREQDTKKQISAQIEALARASSQVETDLGVIISLQNNIKRLREARNIIINEIERRFPKYANLTNPRPLKFKVLRGSIHPDESLISIFLGQNRSFIWAITKDRPVVYTSVPIGEKDVQKMVNQVLYSLQPKVRTAGDIPSFDLDVAYALFQTFLEPVKGQWLNAKRLIVIPHEALNNLPFSMLPTNQIELISDKELLFGNYRQVHWLIRTHAITIFPSVSTLISLRNKPKSSRNRLAFVGFGDPYFSAQQAEEASKLTKHLQPGTSEKYGDYTLRGLKIKRIKTDQLDSAELEVLPRLPETAEEIRIMAETMNADLKRDVFIGIKANEKMVKTIDLSQYRVLAFATHGLAPGDLNGLLQPALALSSPKVAGVDGDGLLKMEEILGLQLDADCVVLSACNTGSGWKKGSEALTGLCRAFFYAGARSLLITNWPVETTSAMELTTELFKRKSESPKISSAEALRQAALSLIDNLGYVDQQSGKMKFSYAHPIFWAPFTLVGDSDLMF